MAFISQGEEITFTDYEDSDFENFVTCYNRYYRGGYPKVEYFERNSLNEKIKTGNLLLTLGKLNDGTVVSVSAAKYHAGPLKGIVELFMRCVDPDYQGRHIGTEHEKYLLKRIKEYYPNISSLQADAVTYDIKSQKTLLKNGFVLCGFCMMMYDITKVIPDSSYKAGTRMSFAIYCKPQKFSPVDIYAPEEHYDFISSIYKRLNVKANFLKPETREQTLTEYRFVHHNGHKNSELYITVPGNDGAKEMFAKLKDLLLADSTVAAHINLSHPGCVQMYRKLQKYGFYFAGIRPLGDNCQYLVVAQTKNSKCGFETVLIPDSENKFLEYIINGGNFQ